MRRGLFFVLLAGCNGSVVANPPPPQYPYTIRADNGPFVPIVYRGAVIGRTDKSGSATLLANLPPNESIELTLKTSSDQAFARHTPVDPTLTFAVGPSDEVVVLNQAFAISPGPVHYVKPPDKPKPF